MGDGIFPLLFSILHSLNVTMKHFRKNISTVNTLLGHRGVSTVCGDSNKYNEYKKVTEFDRQRARSSSAAQM